MADEKLDKHSWKVSGKCIKTQYPDIQDDDITIPEQIGNLAMRSATHSIVGDDSFGSPISAELAVQLIKNADTQTTHLFHSFLADKHDEKTEELVNNLTNLAYGVAFSKSIILKILSQPNCEGLRSYLCATESKGPAHYSLVLVGIDIDGYDLNYPPVTKPASSGQIQKPVSNKIQTLSLTGEYGNPPGGGLLKFDSDETDEHYYLLKTARGK